MKNSFSKPNQITYMRILLIPVFVAFLLMEMPYGGYIAAFIFIILSLSDVLDGHIARKKNQVTEVGKILDPIADKLLISAALIFLIGEGVEAWMAIVIISREWLITILRFIIIPTKVIPSSKLGKIKTLSQTIAILFVIINFPFNEQFMLLAVILTIVSGLDQIVKMRNMLDEKILNLPNIITFMRFGLLPVFAFTMLNDQLNYSLIIFGIIVLSDGIDGVSARLTKQVTEFGKAFDSFTDWSVFLISFFLFVILGYVDLIWIFLLIVPAAVITSSKVLFLKKEKKMLVTIIARISVGMTYATIIAILIDFIYKEHLLLITFILIYLSMFRYAVLSSKLFRK
jgi:CDP-diacylglycerol---glycerol-3-phosphate 3-phosphatidyltransferase